MSESPALNTSTSSTLLDGLFHADNAALWGEFDRRYRPIIVNFARRMGLAAADAADVAQDSLLDFLKAYRAGKYDRQRGRLRSWIVSIVRYRVLDWRRKAAKRPDQAGSDGVSDVPDDSRLEELWEQERRQGLLRQALEEVRKNTRTSEKTVQAFELYVLKQQAADTVAAELGLSVQDVYMAKNRVAESVKAIVARLDTLFDDG